MNTIKNKLNRDFVTTDMIRRIEESAKKMGVTVDEYYEIRKERKNKVLGAINSLRKKGAHKGVQITRASNFNNIKGGLLELGVENREITIKAFINGIGKKPNIIGDIDKLTFAEKNNVRKKVYGYFSSLQES